MKPAVPDVKEEEKKVEDWRDDPQKVAEHRAFTEEVRKAKALEEPEAAAAKKTEAPQMALLPCPFCAGLAREDFSIHLSERSVYFAWIECENANSCGCSVRQFGNYDKEYAVGVARRAWNRRATPSLEPTGPKSSCVSEFSQTDLSGASNGLPSSVTETSANRNEPPSPAHPTSLETGGRNALNLQIARLRETLESLREEFSGHVMQFDDGDIDAADYITNALQDARAASDGKEQEQDLGNPEAQ